MRFKFRRVAFYFLCFIQSISVCQTQHICLQTNYGNALYSHPDTKTSFFIPTGDLTFLATSAETDLDKTSGFFLAGFGYDRCVQTYDVLTLRGRSTEDFITNEFLINIGGMVRYNLFEFPDKKIFFINLALFTELGMDYTAISAEEGHTVVSIFSRGNAPVPVSRYSWNYYQFYFSGFAQTGIEVSDRASFLIGVKPRIFFYEENIGAVEKPKFNYSPLKICLTLGFQFKLF